MLSIYGHAHSNNGTITVSTTQVIAAATFSQAAIKISEFSAHHSTRCSCFPWKKSTTGAIFSWNASTTGPAAIATSSAQVATPLPISTSASPAASR